MNLDTIVAVVEKLTSTNATQDWIDTVVDDIVSADWRQRVALQSNNSSTLLHSTER